MVEQAFYVPFVPFQMGFGIRGVPCQRRVAVTHSVRFEVRFRDDVQSVAVTKLVPVRVIRVVRGAYGVEVVFLENPDVFQHALPRNDVTAVGVHLVAVGAFDEDWLPVDAKLSVFDPDFPKSRVQGDGFERLSGSVFQQHGYAVKCRHFSAPRLHTSGIERQAGRCAGDFHGPDCKDFSVRSR